MSNPVFIDIPGGIAGAIINGPNGGFCVSVFHHATGRSLFGYEQTLSGAYGWLDGARLVFCDGEGTA